MRSESHVQTSVDWATVFLNLGYATERRGALAVRRTVRRELNGPFSNANTVRHDRS